MKQSTEELHGTQNAKLNAFSLFCIEIKKATVKWLSSDIWSMLVRVKNKVPTLVGGRIIFVRSDSLPDTA